MKKLILVVLVLLLPIAFADAASWVDRPTTLAFNDCPAQLKVVRYGLNYITSGDNEGKANVYVEVNAKTSVMLGCAYFKVYGPTGNLIFKSKRRIRAIEGENEHVYAQVPEDAIGGATGITAEVGVGCDCNKPGY
jgi:hypothetical protein